MQWNDQAVLTGHDGKFLFDVGDSGSSGTLQVTKPGFYASPDGDGAANVSLQNTQPDPMTVRLFPEALITGTLTTTDGTPIPRIPVIAQRSTYNDGIHQWSPAGQNQTNSRGEFRIALPPGDYRLETSFQPRLAGTANSVISLIYPSQNSSDTLDNILHLRSGTEERVALHPDVVPTYPVALKVELTGERGFPRITARSSTGAAVSVNLMRYEPGAVSRVELPLGTYTLTAFMNLGESSEYGESQVTVTGQNTPEVVLHMASVPAIPVEVIADQGLAATSDKVPMPQQLGLALNTIQESGRFGNSMVGLVQSRDRSYFHPSPGTYRLVSRSAGPWFIKSASYGVTDLLQSDLVVAPGAGSSPIVLTVSNQTGSVLGTASIHGVPSPAWIYLIPAGPAANLIYSVRSGTTGAFNLAYLPAGSYQAVAFELRHQENYRDPSVLSKYATFVKSVTITAGNKAMLDLNAIAAGEMLP
ncbi:MAG: hypothetical protein JSS95_05045 [Acidobacteria bacterium]|nr:hypothetical protein [Acidobacteriota bacterium]